MDEKITWHLEKRQLLNLHSYSKNPRQLSIDEALDLEESITAFGLIDKPIINLDNTVIGGHQRIALLKKLKYKEIECWVPSRTLDESEVEELNIRLNKNIGQWDWDILANEWNLDDLLAWGFTPEQFAIDIAPISEEKIEDEDPERCPECKQKLKKNKR